MPSFRLVRNRFFSALGFPTRFACGNDVFFFGGVMIRKTFLRLHWMPITVFLIGIFSIVLLAWVNRINDQQRADFLFADALMDMQIHTATFHLWLEEIIAGDVNEDDKHFWNDIEEAERLADAVINGGEAEDGSLLKPLRDPALLARAETVKSLLAEFKAIAVMRLQNRETSGIGSALDVNFDDMFVKILDHAKYLERAVEAEKVRNQTTSTRLFRSMLAIWTLIVFAATAGLFNRELTRRAAETELLKANEQLQAQTSELRAHREHLADLVEVRTQELTWANKSLELEVIERRKAEEELTDSRNQLRHLSSSILSAQEEERGRISRELHDGLGQSLTLMKIQLRSVERRLREDQETLREDCEGIMRYMNTVLEDVRRLSKDLRPFILDDLGLTRSLGWLVDTYAKNGCELRLVMDPMNIDHLFARKPQTCIYRIMQEALTNITKHSGAGRASITIRSDGEAADFSIEDDGSGFDMTAHASLDAAERGLGLASMEERVRTLGGSLALDSEPGKGTRISFRIPVMRADL